MIRQAGCVVAVAAVLAVGGCTKDDPAPPTSSSTSVGSGTTTSSATSSSPPTTSATATPTYPADLPDAAKAHTREGAIAMAKYFVAQIDEAYVSADSQTVKAISDPGCVGCSGIVQEVDANRAKGWRQNKAAMSIAAVLPENHGVSTVDLLINNAAVQFVDETGAVATSAPSSKLTLRVTLSWVDEMWLVTGAGTVNT